jgi:hypothetical protein
MMRWLRRLLLLGLLGGGGYAGYNAWKRKNQSTPAATPSWPPFESSPPPKPAPSTAQPQTISAAKPVAATEPAPVDGVHWVAPVDGQCPDGYPVKANDNSGIFHVPGGRFYARTVPERCYANATDAEADGYRPAKA